MGTIGIDPQIKAAMEQNVTGRYSQQYWWVRKLWGAKRELESEYRGRILPWEKWVNQLEAADFKEHPDHHVFLKR